MKPLAALLDILIDVIVAVVGLLLAGIDALLTGLDRLQRWAHERADRPSPPLTPEDR